MDISELNNDDVISVPIACNPLGRPLFQVHELKSAVERLRYKMFDDSKIWFQSGVGGAVLDSKAGGWKKGKFFLRVTVEFVPDEPDLKT